MAKPKFDYPEAGILLYNYRKLTGGLEDYIMEQNGPVILHSFKKDGEVYPPTYVECKICSYVASELEFGFSGEIIVFACGALEKFVNSDDWCSNFDLDRSAVSDEVLERIDKLEKRGKLSYQANELSEEEMKRFGL